MTDKTDRVHEIAFHSGVYFQPPSTRSGGEHVADGFNIGVKSSPIISALQIVICPMSSGQQSGEEASNIHTTHFILTSDREKKAPTRTIFFVQN